MEKGTRYRLNSGEIIEVCRDVLYVFPYPLKEAALWNSNSRRKRRKVITQGFGMDLKYILRIEYYDPSARTTRVTLDVSPIPIQGTSSFFEYYTKI